MTIRRRMLAAISAAGIAIATSLGMAAPAMAAATVSPTVLTTGTYGFSSAYNPAGTKVAVAAFGSPYTTPPIASEVDLIDTATNAVTVITDIAITAATGVAWSPDGTSIYVLNADGTLVQIDAATHAVTASTSTGLTFGYGLAVSPDGQTIMASDYSGGDVAVVGASNLNVQTTITGFTDGVTYALFYSPDGSTVYAVGYYGNVDYIRTSDNTIVDTQTFANMSYGGLSACQSFDGATLFMADYNEDSDAVIARLDVATGASTSVTANVDESMGCAMTPDGKHVLFGAYGSENPTTVTEFDAATLAYVTTYDTSVADNSDALASSPKNCDVYVANYASTTNILKFTCALPDTGASQGLVITLASVGGGLLVLGVVAMILVRRRKAKA